PSSSSSSPTSTPTSTRARRSASSRTRSPRRPARTSRSAGSSASRSGPSGLARFARPAPGERIAWSAVGDPVFKRVLLKLSGEALMGDLDYGVDPERIKAIASQVKVVVDSGVELAIVVGAGNIYRGMKGAAAGMDRA